MSAIDFLKPDNEQIRHHIRGILDSYSHEWDLLAELTQNSVDAIRASSVDKGRLELTIDASRTTLMVADNGIGIDPARIEKLLRPFGTDKYGKASQIGEKGVGLKFVIFSSSRFTLDTENIEGACTANIVDAAAWVASSTLDPLILDLEQRSGNKDCGTRIEVTLADKDHPLFDLSFEQLIFILRTKTAIGDTGYIWGQPLNCDIKFVYLDKAGNRSVKTFDCRYLLPTEPLHGQGIEDLDEFQDWLRADPDRSDQEKRRKLLNKIVYTKGQKIQSGREIRYWSCFVPKRDFWTKLSVAAGTSPEQQNSTTMDTEADPLIGFNGGFQTATKGMPTGISLELKPEGSAGYISNFFMLVDDPSLNFDIGRKSIHGRQQGLLKNIAYENFREYINKARKYLGGDIDPDSGEWNKDEFFAEVEGLPNLDSSTSRFTKRPNAQEATVAAMFFEQLGQGKFPDLRPLISGYKNRYDLYATWKNRRIVMEFKYDLQGLFADFSDERKVFSEINVVVVWEITESDRTFAKRRGMGVERIGINPLVNQLVFPGATHKLTLGDVTPISIIELRLQVDTSSYADGAVGHP